MGKKVQQPIVKTDKSNKFDKIIKENINKSALPIINHLFALNIDDNQLSEVSSLNQTTFERETDVLKKVTFNNNDKKDFLIQIEFQTKNEVDMNMRMLEYFGILYRKYKLPIKQYVIYIGKDKMNMSNTIIEEDLNFKFEIIDIRSINYQEFIKSDIPEFVILGVLAQFGKDSPETASKNILERIDTITNTDERYKNTLEKEKYLQQIDIISQLRDNLQHTIIKTINNMAFTLNIKKDLRYKEGKLEGKVEGKLEGKVEGKLEGKVEEKNNIILKGYAKGMNITDLADICEVSIDYVKKIIGNK